jgi:tetratricopeptide (TPR) repeat protein
MNPSIAHLPKLLGAFLILTLGARPALAQELALKRILPPDIPMACAAAVEFSPPTPGAAAEAERLRSAAQQVTLLGEPDRARELLQRAVALDPSAAELAYHHARILEALGQPDAAFGEYCRYLALTPESAETAEISRHTAAIAPLRSPLSALASAAFTSGLEHFDAGEFDLAVAEFKIVVEEAPDWATAYYNQALALLARGDLAAAIRGLDTYLALAPEAEDLDDVTRELTRLATPPPVFVRRFNPAIGLGAGTLVPGLGQFYTRRATPGLLALAAAGGATYIALRTSSPRAPSSPAPSATAPPHTRPYLTAGLGTAAAITILSAIEAALYAARDEVPEHRASHHDPGSPPPHRAARLAPLALYPAGDGLRIDLGVRIAIW